LCERDRDDYSDLVPRQNVKKRRFFQKTFGHNAPTMQLPAGERKITDKVSWSNFHLPGFSLGDI